MSTSQARRRDQALRLLELLRPDRHFDGMPYVDMASGKWGVIGPAAMRHVQRPPRAPARKYSTGSGGMGSTVIGTFSPRHGACGGEDGSYGSFVAFEVDVASGVVKGEHTRRQSENDGGVGAHDGVEISAIVRVHLDPRARRPHLENEVVDRDPDRR